MKPKTKKVFVITLTALALAIFMENKGNKVS